MLELSKREVWPLVEAAVKEVTDDLSGPLLARVAEIEARLAASHLALIGLRPPFGSLHNGMSPQRSGSSHTSPIL